MKVKRYVKIARAFDAYNRCIQSKNAEWEPRWRSVIETECRFGGPLGSGWDEGTRFNFDLSKPDRIIFYGEFHHMNDGGFYDGWTDHAIIVKPSLAQGIEITVMGRNRNEIKSYLAEMFHSWLMKEVEEYNSVATERSK